MSVTTFRDSILKLSPPPLQRYWGARYLYSLAIQLDALGDALLDGVRSRFPNVVSDESLPLIGRDRRIIRGFTESADSYATRLRSWLDDHRRAGNPFTLLRQIQGYLTPHAVRLRYVNNAGVWLTLNTDASIEIDNASAWDWDGSSSQWSRFWIVLYPPAALWVEDGTWGDGDVWGNDATTWGSTATPEQVATVQTIVRQWRGPHSICKNIIVSFDDTAFDPTDTAPPLPDGTWANWGKRVGPVQVPARDSRAIYWDGGS